jgi:hypothetical protein
VCGVYRVGYVSALASTGVLFPASTARRCRVRFRRPVAGFRKYEESYAGAADEAARAPRVGWESLCALSRKMAIGLRISTSLLSQLTRNKRNSRLGQGLHQICGRMEVIRFGKFVIDQHWIAHTRSRPYIRFAFKKRYHPSSDVFLISQLGISSNAAPSKMHPCCQSELR